MFYKLDLLKFSICQYNYDMMCYNKYDVIWQVSRGFAPFGGFVQHLAEEVLPRIFIGEMGGKKKIIYVFYFFSDLENVLRFQTFFTHI